MLNLNCKIKVFVTDSELKRTGVEYEFNYAYDIKIDSSVKSFTDTAEIKIPKKIVVNQLNSTLGFEIQKNLPFTLETKSIYEFLKQDNFIEVFLGYDGDYKPAFRGYIRQVVGDAPVCIQCEDEMYVLKKRKMRILEQESEHNETQNPIALGPSKTLKGDEITEELQRRLNELNINSEVNIDTTLGSLVIDRKASIAKFLQKLKDEYSIYSFFKLEKDQSVLFVTNNPDLYEKEEITQVVEVEDKSGFSSRLTGIPKELLKKAVNILGIPDIINFFTRDDGFLGEAKFRFFYNIISDNLKVNNSEVNNIRFRVEKHFVNSNTPIQEDFGDPEDGQLVTTYKIHDNDDELPTNEIEFKKKEQEVKAELKNFLAVRFAQVKKSGLQGSFITFGEPFVRPTDRVILEDAEDVEKNGIFQVDAVKRSFGLSGYRQEITVGRRVS